MGGELVRQNGKLSSQNFEIAFLTEYSDEALLAELRRVASLIPEGEFITKPAYERNCPRASSSTLQRRFGSWKCVLNSAGLGHRYVGTSISEKMKLQPAKLLSDNDLLRELRRVQLLVGTEWLTSDDFNANSLPVRPPFEDASEASAKVWNLPGSRVTQQVTNRTAKAMFRESCCRLDTLWSHTHDIGKCLSVLRR